MGATGELVSKLDVDGGVQGEQGGCNGKQGHGRVLGVEELHKHGQVTEDDHEELERDNPPVQGEVDTCGIKCSSRMIKLMKRGENMSREGVAGERGRGQRHALTSESTSILTALVPRPRTTFRIRLGPRMDIHAHPRSHAPQSYARDSSAEGKGCRWYHSPMGFTLGDFHSSVFSRHSLVACAVPPSDTTQPHSWKNRRTAIPTFMPVWCSAIVPRREKVEITCVR
mmetsp:Transcript_12417/g.33869  ORF Transcript_12417/g.33869 Transcript_12417/m.33869 type:complete len:226 (+) Transcript_12417:523-1200(+)